MNNATQIGADAPTTLTVGSLYRVGLYQKTGTNNNAILDAYLVSGDTPFDLPFASSIFETFTTQATQLKIGAPSGTQASITFDDVMLDTMALPPPSPRAGVQGASAVMSASSATNSLQTRSTQEAAAVSAAAPVTDSTAQAARGQFGTLPLAFMPNAGLHDSAVRYHARGMGGMLFFTPQEIVLAVPTNPRPRSTPHDPRPTQTITATQTISMSVVRLNYIGASATPVLTATNQLPGATNYFLGKNATAWRTNVPAYAGVVYQGLYPGIDVRFDGTDGHLKNTYTVAAGADPSRLRWRYTGASQVQAALGSVRRTVTDSGVPLGVVNYDPWGTPETGTVPTFGFTGELHDSAATNLGTLTNNYDALGRRTSLVDGTGTTSFTPDALGPITQVNAPNTGTILYGYDRRGLRTRLTYPGTSAPIIDYSYFDDGNLNQVKQRITTLATYGYDPVGRLQSVALPGSYRIKIRTICQHTLF